MKTTKSLLFLFLLVTCLSCDKDSESTDKVTSGRMTVNGVTRTFAFNGRGIMLQSDGTYELETSMYTTDGLPETYDYVAIKLRYKKKGNNVLEVFRCYANPNGTEANAVGATLKNKVTVNNRKQLTLTFSGTMQNGSEVVTITDGYMNYIYETPFDE